MLGSTWRHLRKSGEAMRGGGSQGANRKDGIAQMINHEIDTAKEFSPTLNSIAGYRRAVKTKTSMLNNSTSVNEGESNLALRRLTASYDP